MHGDLHNLFPDFENAKVAMRRDNSIGIVSDFAKKIGMRDHDDLERRTAVGWLSTLAASAYKQSCKTKTPTLRQLFRQRLIDSFSQDVPDLLRLSGPTICGKFQPSFLDCLVPTLNRLEALERFTETCGPEIEAVILGGSLSYIPFLGIREGPDAGDHSDIDLLVVVNESFFEPANFKALCDTDLLSPDDIERFEQRRHIFSELFLDGFAEVFSHRFSVRGSPFSFSMHFIGKSLLQDRLVHTPIRAMKCGKDLSETLNDYRQSAKGHPCLARHSLDGRRLETAHEALAADLGGVFPLPSFDVIGGRFFPGPLLTVISPSFDVFFDRTGDSKQSVFELRTALEKEAAKAKYNHPFPSVALAHNRTDIFPPGRYSAGVDCCLKPSEIEVIQRFQADQVTLKVSASIAKIDAIVEQILSDRSRYAKMPIAHPSEPYSLLTVRSESEEPSQFIPNSIMRQDGYRQLSFSFRKIFVMSRLQTTSAAAHGEVHYEVVALE